MTENIVLTIDPELTQFEINMRYNPELTKLEWFQKAYDAIEFLQDLSIIEDDSDNKNNIPTSSDKILGILKSKISEIEKIKLADWKFNMENK